MNNESDFHDLPHNRNPDPRETLVSGSFFDTFLFLACTSFRIAYCRVSSPEREFNFEHGMPSPIGTLTSRSVAGTELTVEYELPIAAVEHKDQGELFTDLLSQALKHQKFGSILPRQVSTSNLSPYLQASISSLIKIARSRAPVAISGDTGTGKNFLARWIHECGLGGGPCIVVDIAAIPEQLLELELFGYVEGAFTDAKSNRPGKISLAHGGTLVLDGIESTSLANQAKLLRVLQDGSFYPLGSGTLVKVSCRVIVLSQIRLEVLLTSGRLREDLYYRINVLPVHLKPLRERQGDIEYFVGIYGADFGASAALIASLAKEANQMQWAGNVRELHNFLTSRFTLSDSASGVSEPQAPETQHSMGLKNAIRLYKKAYIHDILRSSNGNQTQAARILGIERTYLARLIKELLIRI